MKELEWYYDLQNFVYITGNVFEEFWKLEY